MFKRLIKLLLFAALLPFFVLLGLLVFRVGPEPQIEVSSDRPGIGKRTVVTVAAREPQRGLGRVTVTLLQEEHEQVVASNAKETYRPRRFWAFWGPRHAEETFEIPLGREATPALKPGVATLRVTAERAGTWLRRPGPAVKEITLPVRFAPPSIERVSREVYLTQGGSEVVAYRVGETSVRDGVQAGDWFFPGYPLPGGGARDRLAILAMPYDLADVSKVQLVAQDDLGNTSVQSCVDKFFPKPFKKDTIPVSDAFMSKVVPEILSHTPEMTDRGALLDNYLALNRDLRKANAQRLNDLATRSKPEFLWRRTFLPVANAAVRSSFADRRTYVYNGQAVDQQDHLGFDMASVQRAPVQSVNDGVVALAEYFGIYGNTVVVDHGFGLMSLYGHLSEIATKEGDKVTRGQVLGKTGDTGLAAGDHLHFAMLLHGLAVNPIEWWDEHWILDRMVRKLGPALPFETAAAAAR
jgi:murein DD-endopeptidase MepM/ murein hydrolase activator NlpD